MTATAPANLPSTTSPDAPVPISDVSRRVLRHKWLVVLITLVVAGASIASAVAAGVTYTSKASVVVVGTPDSSTGAQQLMATTKRLAGSRTVAELVIRNLALTESPERLLAGLSVSNPLDTQILDFGYTSASAAEAERFSGAFASAFLQYQGSLQASLVTSSRSIDQLADSLRSRLVGAQAAVAAATDPAASAQAQKLVTDLTNEIASVEQRRASLLAEAPTVSVLAEDAAPGVRSDPSIVRAAVVGVLAGFVLGVFAALAFDLLMGQRRRPSEEVEIVGRPTVSTALSNGQVASSQAGPAPRTSVVD
jgi:capsular polysaccharide biosynthesis protein